MKKILIFCAAFLLTAGQTQGAIVLTADDPKLITFPDLTENYIYYDAVMYLSSEGVVNGYPDGTFKPEKSVNRAEMLKILVAGTGIAKTEAYITGGYSEKSCFPDVPVSQWYTEYVCYAESRGWVKGYTDGTFRPDQTISFVEALKIAFKAFGIPYSEGDPWYQNAVDYASQWKYIPFTISDFHQPLDRGTMSDLAARIRISLEEGAIALDEYLGERKDILPTYETISQGINLGLLEPDPPQTCEEGTILYRNGNDNYEFCYKESGKIAEDDFYGVTISAAPVSENDILDGSIAAYDANGLSADEYLDISEVGEISDKTEFTNKHGVTGLEYDIFEANPYADTDYTSHGLIFGNQYKTKVVKINYSFAEYTDIEFMQTIKNTFKFIRTQSDSNDHTENSMENLTDPTEYINDSYFNFYDTYLEFNPDITNYTGAQDCGSGKNVYRNEYYKYEFCYDDDELQIATDSTFQMTFLFEKGTLVNGFGPPAGYLLLIENFGIPLEDYTALFEITDIGISFQNFTNSHNLKGAELKEGGDFLTINLILLEKNETLVELLHLLEEDTANSLNLVKDTFRFYQ